MGDRPSPLGDLSTDPSSRPRHSAQETMSPSGVASGTDTSVKHSAVMAFLADSWTRWRRPSGGFPRRLGALATTVPLAAPTGISPDRRTAPECCDGKCGDPVAERERARSGVEDDATHESIPKLVAQPSNVSGVATFGRRGRLHVDGHDPVRLQSMSRSTSCRPSCRSVVNPRPTPTQFDLGPELGGHERVEDSADQVAVG